MAKVAACVPLLLFLLAGMTMIDRSNAATQAPAASPVDAVCSEAITSLVSCLSYVEEGGTASKPEGTCCSGLKNVVKTNVICLCDALKNAASFGITLNMTRALALPDACRVSTPPSSECKIADSGAASPAPSPASLFFKGAPVGSPGATGGAAVPSPAPVNGINAAPLQATVVGSLLISAAAIVQVVLPLI